MRMSHLTLTVDVQGPVAVVSLARPDRANALDATLWRELREAFAAIDATAAIRVAVLRGAGAHFTSGIDLAMLASLRGSLQVAGHCEGRGREALRRLILDLQDVITSVERCRKPVLAAIHGACIGAGVDLVTACDARYCTVDTRFSVREVDMGLTADVGTLQRLPRLVGEGLARELAYTARTFDGREALAMRLVNRCFDTPDELFAGVLELARTIASKSPLAVRGTKAMLNYARDHSVADSLEHVATWNAAMLLSRDLDEAIAAQRERREPRFDD
jgi:enoyl-CoA hydratase/carnithine racemase